MSAFSPEQWLADRTQAFDSSGIRKVFDLAAKLENPVNLSIGQPDFDVPQPVQEAAIAAIRQGKNGYTVSQGIEPLRDALRQRIARQYPHPDRDVFICSGTSGGLVLAILSLVNPGDEVIVFDPYFVMYVPLVKLAGGIPVLIDTYPDFRLDVERVEQAISPRTKLILFNAPGNPTGVTPDREDVRRLAELAAERHIALLSDEIYSQFVYEGELVSPAEFNPQTIVVDGFSKSHAMTGWRVGWVHGPAAVLQTMIKLQQYSFVCAPQPAQWAGLAALDYSMADHGAAYRRKRDLLIDGLRDRFEFTTPGGAFYLFPKAPGGLTGSQFVEKAIANNLLIIPGKIFSRQDTHFRISYAASDATIRQGIAILNRLADEATG
ncbi:MAG: aminotransferase [Pirellulaceae bacterium]|nr:MAG: aminotransferase [Pirellulaceae bacterium]